MIPFNLTELKQPEQCGNSTWSSIWNKKSCILKVLYTKHGHGEISHCASVPGHVHLPGSSGLFVDWGIFLFVCFDLIEQII